MDPINRYKFRAKEQHKEGIINKIILEAFEHEHNKHYLCSLVLDYDMTFTDQKRTFIRWMRGNGIQFEKHNLTESQEQKLIEKALNLKSHFLVDVKQTINQMRKRNGDPPAFHI